jgi:adenylate kinase
MNLILLGIPGSGKGSTAELLTCELKFPHFAPGDILREELKQKSRWGLLARPFMEKGELVPDRIILEIIEKRLNQPASEKGFILDGFPRTLIQAESLDRLLTRLGKKIDLVFNLEISNQTALKRLAGRQTCSVCGAIYNIFKKPPEKKDVCDACGGALLQRADDTEEVIRNRLEIYRQNSQQIEEYYMHQEKLRSVDAEVSSSEVFKQILNKLRTYKPKIGKKASDGGA